MAMIPKKSTSGGDGLAHGLTALAAPQPVLPSALPRLLSVPGLPFPTSSVVGVPGAPSLESLDRMLSASREVVERAHKMEGPSTGAAVTTSAVPCVPGNDAPVQPALWARAPGGSDGGVDMVFATVLPDHHHAPTVLSLPSAAPAGSTTPYYTSMAATEEGAPWLPSSAAAATVGPSPHPPPAPPPSTSPPATTTRMSVPPASSPDAAAAATAVSLLHSAITPPLPQPPPPSTAAAPSPAPALWLTGCRDISTYTSEEIIGEGTYGTVTRARGPDGALVAVKKLKLAGQTVKDGFPLVTIREIRALRALRHDNIVQLVDVVTSRPTARNRNLGDVYMVFEYCKHDMSGLLGSGYKLSDGQIRSYMHQLVSAVAYMHRCGWLHRDLKTANLLLSEDNVLKVADLGLAKNTATGKKDPSFEVVTMWYKAPELMLADPASSFGIDMWSVGCIFGEMLNGGRPVFSGDNEREQMRQIYRLCGAVTRTTWPGVDKLPGWVAVKPDKVYTAQMRQPTRFGGLPPHAFDLLEKLLTPYPPHRITAEQALSHPYFMQDGGLVPRALLPALPHSASHEMVVKQALMRDGGGGGVAPPPPSNHPAPTAPPGQGGPTRDDGHGGGAVGGPGAVVDAALARFVLGDGGMVRVPATLSGHKRSRVEMEGEVGAGGGGESGVGGSGAGGGKVAAGAGLAPPPPLPKVSGPLATAPVRSGAGKAGAVGGSASLVTSLLSKVHAASAGGLLRVSAAAAGLGKPLGVTAAGGGGTESQPPRRRADSEDDGDGDHDASIFMQPTVTRRPWLGPGPGSGGGPSQPRR